MSDVDRPGIGTRVRAALRGERRAEALEAMRAAGGAVYGELAEAERARADLLVTGGDPWAPPPAVAGHLVATWNAFVLQTLAETLLDADYADDPGTAGYLPPVTFEQAWTWLATAAEWLSIARQARASPEYDSGAQVRLPADPPDLGGPRPAPPVHLVAMLAAVAPLRDHIELALYDLERGSDQDDRPRRLGRLRQLAAEASTAAEYAGSLCHGAGWTAGSAGRDDDRLREFTGTHLAQAVRLLFHLGQLAAMPALIPRYRPERALTRTEVYALPGRERFDRWCLTDPATREMWQQDQRARIAVNAMWSVDPDPAYTLGIQAEIDQALADGDVVRARRGGTATYYFRCPWPPVYRVRRAVRIAGRRLSAPQQFTFHIEAEHGRFVREIVVGPFDSTADIDYWAPAP
jgi:hypothetical protein